MKEQFDGMVLCFLWIIGCTGTYLGHVLGSLDVTICGLLIVGMCLAYEFDFDKGD